MCLCCIFESTSAFFVWRALRNFATCVHDGKFEENVEEMVGTTREAAAVSGGAATTGDATAGDETAATGGVMYMDEGE